jgi:hypothetical protein
MPRVLFLVNLIEYGLYICHARVRFASARELQEFLARNSVRERDGWSIAINTGPDRGYDGKPLHHADIRLSAPLTLPEQFTPLPSQETADFAVSDRTSVVEYGRNASEEQPEDTRRTHLTWEQRGALQKASKALLTQLGVSDLGWWR